MGESYHRSERRLRFWKPDVPGGSFSSVDRILPKLHHIGDGPVAPALGKKEAIYLDDWLLFPS